MGSSLRNEQVAEPDSYPVKNLGIVSRHPTDFFNFAIIP